MKLTLFLIVLAATAASVSVSPDIVLQSGHGANISALAFSADGKFLASASEDSTIKLWDPNTGGEIRTLRGHTNIVTALAISRDGTHIASAALDHTLRVWDTATGASLAVLRGPAPTVYLLKITPDANFLVTAETVPTGTILRLFDIRGGKQTHMMKRDDAAVSNIFFSGVNRMMVAEESGEDDSTGALVGYQWPSGKPLDTHAMLLCGASDDGKWLAIDRSSEVERRAAVIEAATNRSLPVLSGQVSRVVFSANGEWLAYESTAGDSAVVRRVAGGPSRTIRGRSAEFSMIALSPDGKLLASPGADFSVHIWDTETGKLAHAMSGQYTPTALAFSADDRQIAANGGGTDLGSALQVWDVERKALMWGPRFKRSVSGVAFSANGAYLAAGAPDLQIYDAKNGGLIAKHDCDPVASFPAFSVNGNLVAANCGGVVTIWPVNGRDEVVHFGAKTPDAVGPLAFSPDGKFLAAGMADGAVLCDIAARKLVYRAASSVPVTAVAFNHNGELLAYGVRQTEQSTVPQPTLFLVEARTHRRLWNAVAGQWLTGLKFVSQGRGLLVAAGALSLYETANGRQVRRLIARVPGGANPAFSANGEWFAVGANSAISLWRIREP